MLPDRSWILPLSFSLLGALLWGATTLAQEAVEEFRFDHEDVLGTSMTIQVRASSREEAVRAEERVLNEIHRLAKILSNHDPDSEFRRWQAAPAGSTVISPELFEVMQEADRYRELSGGAFHPAVQSLLVLWAEAARQGQRPNDEEIAEARAVVARPLWRLDRVAGTAGRLGNAPLTLDAIAKGFIIDRAVAAGIGKGNQVKGLLVNIGGDLLARGDLSLVVGIADPRNDTETSPPLARIPARDRAVATSGGYQRRFEIDGHKYSHIIDPRTGMPASGILSATVVAPRAADADVLATILCLEPIEEGVRLVDSLPEIECLLVSASGKLARSRGWPAMERVGIDRASEASPRPTPSTSPGSFDLLLTFEIRRPEGRSSYRRPYVAIWVEDPTGATVRTLALWVQAEGIGPRWIPDLRRWYRGDRQRKLGDPTDLVDTISRATRPPGRYQVLWDRKDDRGQAVPDGQYTLLIEAVREHGTYQLLRQPLTLGSEPFTETLEGNPEITSALIEYRQSPLAE